MMMENLTCLCGSKYDPEVFSTQCDTCKNFLSGSCCDFREFLLNEEETFRCKNCEQNWNYQSAYVDDFLPKPVRTGTRVFVNELKKRHFFPEDDILVRFNTRGDKLTEEFLWMNGFNNPIVLDQKEEIGVKIPDESFTINDVELLVGKDKVIDVIDVCRQVEIKMRLTDFVRYFNDVAWRRRILNCVSLEFSDSCLSAFVDAPTVVRKIDWADNVWPRELTLEKPRVQKYCLMSVEDSFTDFHIDFGGSSVWYHVLRGEKIFYFIKPTSANLMLYQQWMMSTNRGETFFGDQVDQCFKCTVRQGQTMLIPTGWIHAVLTSTDSLVFGGNFLHELNIPLQLKIYEIEKRIKTGTKFLYPNFELIHWFAAESLYQRIQEKNCYNNMILGLKSLLLNLKQWNMEKNFDMNSSKFLRDFSREIRRLEKTMNTSNPEKLLEKRQSKRRKKTAIKEDFDYSTSPVSNGTSLKIKFRDVVGSFEPADEYSFRQNVETNVNYVPQPVMKTNGLNLEDQKLPQNGIESLLKASALATNEHSGRTSPSTCEAIAGMLSIGRAVPRTQQGNKNNTRNMIAEETLLNVHQDEDYVYPSLENSDDDEFHVFKPRRRLKTDETWNPKARVGPLLPKMNRPIREGTKREAVEKVLEAAAAANRTSTSNGALEKFPKRQYRKKKPKPGNEIKPLSGNPSVATPTPSVSKPTPRVSSQRGLKTVKQRLGKILKIHKMMH